LKRSINGFNNAAKGTPFIVLTDLDSAECAPVLMREWLTIPKHHNLLFRVAVREVEAWVLAHGTAFASFLGLREEVIPRTPDKLDDPKAILIELARKSRRTHLRAAIVPRRGSTAKIGPDYNATLSVFIEGSWDAKKAEELSPSLRRAFKAISDFEPKLAESRATNENK